MELRLQSKEQKEMVLENEKLVYHILNALNVDKSEYEDLASLGKIGLIKAAITFDESNNSKFSTYAGVCIRNEIYMYLRKRKGKNENVSLEEVISIDKNGYELKIADCLEDSKVIGENKIINDESFVTVINIILNVLLPRERYIILYKISGFTQENISALLNISRSYISRIEGNGKEKIIEYLTSNEQFDKKFSIEIFQNWYKFIFTLNNFEKFKVNINAFLHNVSIISTIVSVEIDYDNKQIIVFIPADLENFYLIAEIIDEIYVFTEC